ncbi:MAG: hypothetical protein MI685_08440, partial [Chlorobiales bacterium]|nr:hypothetical protein [Chlorobiales bacterium]
MGKFLKFFVVFLVLLVVAALVFLQMLKPRLSDYIKTMINSSVEARVDYGDADISLFRAFPGISITLHDLLVSEKGGENSDTLGTVSRFSVTFDALSVLSGELSVHSLSIDKP